MTAQTNTALRLSAAAQTDYVLLRRALIVDTLVSGATGVAMALFPNQLATLVGATAPEAVFGIGIGFIVFALFTGTTARETPLNRTKAWAIVWMNVLSIIPSILVSITNVFAINTLGNLFMLIVAVFVAVIGFFEWLGLRRGRATR